MRTPARSSILLVSLAVASQPMAALAAPMADATEIQARGGPLAPIGDLLEKLPILGPILKPVVHALGLDSDAATMSAEEAGPPDPNAVYMAVQQAAADIPNALANLIVDALNATQGAGALPVPLPISPPALPLPLPPLPISPPTLPVPLPALPALPVPLPALPVSPPAAAAALPVPLPTGSAPAPPGGGPPAPPSGAPAPPGGGPPAPPNGAPAPPDGAPAPPPPPAERRMFRTTGPAMLVKKPEADVSVSLGKHHTSTGTATHSSTATGTRTSTGTTESATGTAR